jgi:hypothetical protein
MLNINEAIKLYAEVNRLSNDCRYESASLEKHIEGAITRGEGDAWINNVPSDVVEELKSRLNEAGFMYTFGYEEYDKGYTLIVWGWAIKHV